MTLSAAEQFLIELINRSRLDPAAEAARYGVALNQGLSPGTIDASAKQVLAPNSQLEQAAIRHSNWMLQADVFSHTGVGGSTAGARMQDAGYMFTGSYTWRENLAWTGTTGNISLTQAILEHHEGLYRSAGHRANTFAEGSREIGVGQVQGQFTYQGTTFNTSMLTEKFASSGASKFVTGVAYRDQDRNGFYSIGEGRGDFWIRGGGDGDRTAAAGGYGIDVGDVSWVEVAVGRGDGALARLGINMSQGNAKLDLVIGADGSQSLALSGSAVLRGGISDATLLGRANLALTGTQAANELEGNTGHNRIAGGGGNDVLMGRVGRDVLSGGNGADLLRGGVGEDRLFGGNGWDRLRGELGNDVMYGGLGRDVMSGEQGNDRMFGGTHNDRMFGNMGDDRMYGEAGDDLMHGHAGADRMFGGPGNDLLAGHEGYDLMIGGAGNDRMFGGRGNDLLNGLDGNDFLHGGYGADRFVFTGGRDTVRDFADNVDTLVIRPEFAGSVSDALSKGWVVGSDVMFDFGDGDVLILRGVDDLGSLSNDLVIV